MINVRIILDPESHVPFSEIDNNVYIEGCLPSIPNIGDTIRFDSNLFSIQVLKNVETARRYYLYLRYKPDGWDEPDYIEEEDITEKTLKDITFELKYPYVSFVSYELNSNVVNIFINPLNYMYTVIEHAYNHY